VLAIDTPLSISIPVTVAAGGMVAGEAGALGLTLGAMKDRGRWWTERDQLCMKWFRWFDAKPRCITLKRDGSKVWWYENSGESGTATITEAPAVQIAKPRVTQNVELASADRRAPVIDPPMRPVSEPPRRELRAAVEAAPPMPKPEREHAPVDASSDPVANAPVAKVPQKAHEPAAVAPRRVVKPPATPAQAASVGAPRKPARQAAPVQRPASTSSIALSFRVSRVVDGDMLYVRNGPSEYHDAVGSIPARGRGVQIVGACRELWCPVQHGKLKGWVNRYYLAEDAGQATYSKR
jgi:hypothetical protein